MSVARDYREIDFEVKSTLVLLFLMADWKPDTDLEKSLQGLAVITYEWWITEEGYKFFSACAKDFHQGRDAQLTQIDIFLQEGLKLNREKKARLDAEQAEAIEMEKNNNIVSLDLYRKAKERFSHER